MDNNYIEQLLTIERQINKLAIDCLENGLYEAAKHLIDAALYIRKTVEEGVNE